MSKRVCPWWLGYLLASPLRRWSLNPAALLAPHLREGMTVFEPGPGMGFFTLEMAKLVGQRGRVVAVDLQPKMIERLKRRALKARVADRIDARLAASDFLGISDLAGKVDFTLAYAVVHEMPSASAFFAEAAAASKPGARLLFAEPAGHVTQQEFDDEMKAATAAGFRVLERPSIRKSYAALLRSAIPGDTLRSAPTALGGREPGTRA